MTISSHLPDVLTAYIAARTHRLILDRQAKEAKEYEETLRDTIVSKYREQGFTALGCDVGIVKMSVLTEPVATDWPEVWKYIHEHNAFELLHKRLTSEAVKERWEAGEQIPGVGTREVYKLSVSSPPRKT